jgi:hypothetical protein
MLHFLDLSKILKRMRLTILFSLILFTYTLSAQKGEVFPYAHNGLWGILSEDREIIIEPAFEDISLFKVYMDHATQEKRYYAAAKKEDKYGFINDTGEWLVQPIYDSISTEVRDQKGLYIVQSEGLSGLFTMRPEPRVIVVPKFEDINGFFPRASWAVVKKDEKLGVYDYKSKRMLLPFNYDKIKTSYFFATPEGDLAGELGIQAKKGEDITYFRANGTPYTGAVWEHGGMMEEMPSTPARKPEYHTTFTKIKDKQWLIDIFVINQEEAVAQDTATGLDSLKKVLLAWPKKDQTPPVRLIIGWKNGYCGVLDKKGNVLLPFEYETIETEGNFWTVTQWKLKQKGLWGVANPHFVVTLPCMFTELRRDEGMTHAYYKTPDGYEGYSERNKGKVYIPKSVPVVVPKRSIPFPVSESDKASTSTVGPFFPGGQEALEQFLIENAKIPMTSIVKGRIQLYFKVEKDGSLTKPGVTGRRVTNEVKAELLRLFTLLPKFEPGVSNGYIVRSLGRVTVSLKE